ncbi:hypothetical protein MASR2M41_15840 [Flammeovirgaceae bacterium]
MPARKKPTIPLKKNKRTDEDISVIEKLIIAPAMAQTKNTFEGEKRSEMERRAKIKVPIINPSCTEEVRLPNELAERLKACCNSGSTALPANHNEVHANCAKTIRGRILFVPEASVVIDEDECLKKNPSALNADRILSST